MDDLCELRHVALDPLDRDDAGLDLDGDGLANLQEFQAGTDLDNPDTDGDGISDGREVNERQTDPRDPLSASIVLYADASIGDDAYDGLRPTMADGHGPKRTLSSVLFHAISEDTVSMAEGRYTLSTGSFGEKSLTLRPEGTVTVSP